MKYKKTAISEDIPEFATIKKPAFRIVSMNWIK